MNWSEASTVAKDRSCTKPAWNFWGCTSSFFSGLVAESELEERNIVHIPSLARLIPGQNLADPSQCPMLTALNTEAPAQS